MRELLTAVLQSGGAAAVNLLLTVITTKVMAVVLGPQGVGLLALLRQTYQMILTTATFNGQPAIVQGAAARTGAERLEFLSTVRGVLALTVGGLAVLLLVFPRQIAQTIVGPSGALHADLIRWLCIPLVLGGASLYAGAVLNAYRAIGRLALTGAVGAVVAALTAYPVAALVRSGYPGAFLLQLGIPVGVVTALAFWFIARGGWTAGVTTGRWVLSSAMVRDFMRLAGATLLTGVIAVLVPLVIRAFAVRGFGLAGVGILDVAWTISMTYVMLVVGSFASYYLPALSASAGSPLRSELIRRVFRLETIVLIPLVTGLIALKPLVVRLLYSGDFLASTAIMRWMLIADYFKVSSWVLAYTMLAYADIRTLVWSEFVFSGLNVAGAAFSILGLGTLEGVGVAALAVYGLYLLFSLVYTRRRGHFTLNRPFAITWLLGLVVIVAASVHTWHDTVVRPVVAVAYVAIACLVSSTLVTPAEWGRIRAVAAAATRSVAHLVNRRWQAAP